MSDSDPILVNKISKDIEIADLDHEFWQRPAPTVVTKYWSGEEAPDERAMTTRFLWSDRDLYARFDCNQHEPLIVNTLPDTSRKTMSLWEKDVCEIFIGTDPSEPRKYLEFEAAPNGEWIDLTIDLTGGERLTDWDFFSGMQAAALIRRNLVVIAMKMPFDAFGVVPSVGDLWPGNLYRCVGSGDTRGYLAWQPTMTPETSFHEPDKFGLFEFVDSKR